MWCCGVGVTEAVIPNTGDKVTYIAVGAGVGGGLVVVLAGILVIVVRNIQSKQGTLRTCT